MRESCFYKRGWNASSNLQCLPGSFVCSPRFLCISRACISEPSWFCLYKSGPVAKENGRMRHSDPQVGMKVTFQQLWENLPRSGCRRPINGPLYLLDFRVVCVCVCVVLGTRRSACAQTFQWERCLDEAGLRCVSVGTCLYMNESYAWFVIERQSGVFSSIADTHTHTLDASKSPKCSACVCWDVSQWENTHWQPAAHILLPAGGCDHLQPAHCPLTPGEVSPSSKGLRHSQAWSVGLSAEIVSRVAPHCILGIQS